MNVVYTPTALHIELAAGPYHPCDALYFQRLLVLPFWRLPAEQLVVGREVDKLGVRFAGVGRVFEKEEALSHVVKHFTH